MMKKRKYFLTMFFLSFIILIEVAFALTQIDIEYNTTQPPPEQICIENWQCTAWSPDPCQAGETQTRSCTDRSNCGKPCSDPNVCGTSRSCPTFPSGGGGGGGGTPPETGLQLPSVDLAKDWWVIALAAAAIIFLALVLRA